MELETKPGPVRCDSRQKDLNDVHLAQGQMQNRHLIVVGGRGPGCGNARASTPLELDRSGGVHTFKASIATIIHFSRLLALVCTVTTKEVYMIRALILAFVIFLVATFPATWLLMLFLGNLHLGLSYWGTLPLGILVSALLGGATSGYAPREVRAV